MQTSTGQETHGITASDFAWDAELRPLAGSPLIDAGVIIPGVNDGYSGAAPDIGAFEFAPAVPAILHHHEHFDGTAYPDGLAGDDIPLASRILLVTERV